MPSLFDSLIKTSRFELLRTLAKAGVGPWRERIVQQPLTSRDEVAMSLEDIFEACLQAAFTACEKKHDDPNAWREVATTLAIALFAGNLRPRGGQPVSTKEIERLRADVAELRSAGTCQSVAECCKVLIRRAPYETMKGHRIGENIGLLTAAGLRRRYYKS